jgi:DNA-binding MarR family transcriptional regulator
MALDATVKAEDILNHFADVMTRLLIDQHHQHIAELDITLLQAQVLRVLRRGPLQTGQVAAQLRISAPAITQLTDRLIRKGLIERQAAADDRRCILIALSAKGKRLVDQFRKRRAQLFHNALASLKGEEQERLVEALGKVVLMLEDYESKMAGARTASAGTMASKHSEQ